MNMIKAIFKFLLDFFISFVFISFLIYLISRNLPGNPAALILGYNADAKQIAHLSHVLNINGSLISGYLYWISHIFNQNSLLSGQPVWLEIRDAIKISALLLLLATAFTYVFGIMLGIILVTKKNSLLGKSLDIVIKFKLSIPSFWIAIMAIYLFSLKYNIFSIPDYKNIAIVIPALSISLGEIAILSLLIKNAISEQLFLPYVYALKVKNIPLNVIIVKYVFRHISHSIFSFMAMQLTFIISSMIIVERVFNIPALGSLLLSSIEQKDIPLMDSIIMIYIAVGMFALIVVKHINKGNNYLEV